MASKKKDEKLAVDPLALETEKGIIEEDEDIFDAAGPDLDQDSDEKDEELAKACVA